MLSEKLKIILFAFIFALVFSCGDNTNTITIEPKPKILQIFPDKIYPFDVVTIYGENLGLTPDSVSILIDSVVITPQILKWNNNFIQFIAPKEIKSGHILIIFPNKDTTNSINFNAFPYPKIDFILIPAGSFMMGSETGLAYEKPVHQVIIADSFFISKYEITQKQWLTVMDSNPSNFVGMDLPVANLSWEQAIQFCNKLSKLMGLDTAYHMSNDIIFWDTSANGFRLPTEAEWEYACRAGTTNDFAGNGNPLDMGWFDLNSGGQPHPVGTKLSNQWNIYDMHGNVWEWCWDWFDPFYYSKSPLVNPKGPEKGINKVVRGGSWQLGATFARSSSRQFPEDQKLNFGFRIVRNKK